MEKNIITLTDSYKVSHWKQYPPGTEAIYSYFESRGGQFEQTKFFGLQYFLKEYLEGKVVTADKIIQSKRMFQDHFGKDLFNESGWYHILDKHDGCLPVSIKAVAEGSVVKTSNVLMTIENTDPACFWLTNYLETLLVQVWYPTTVCTLSHEMKKLIFSFLEKTGNPDLIDFKLHDFGFRGVSSLESAMLGGAAHLVNFKGTDTFPATMFTKEYYGSEVMDGFSIPASEHSTITSWGRENEEKAFDNMLTQFGSGMLACVSDSYDIYNACANLWGTKLKNKICFMDGSLVIRPDSGNPADVVLGCLKILGEKFGLQTNDKGYKLLHPKIRLIQGDGIEFESTHEILSAMLMNGWSADNVAFGMGGGLLQKVNRDTQKFAFKCSSIKVGGEWHDVYKDPATDSGKRSKRGRLKLVDGVTMSETMPGDDQLSEVFRDGTCLNEQKFDEIRKGPW